MGLCSYLLIGFYFEKDWCASAGKKAFIVNRIGDFGFMLAMFLAFKVFGTVDFAALKALLRPGDIKVFEFSPGLTVEQVKKGVAHLKAIWGEE